MSLRPTAPFSKHDNDDFDDDTKVEYLDEDQQTDLIQSLQTSNEYANRIFRLTLTFLLAGTCILHTLLYLLTPKLDLLLPLPALLLALYHLHNPDLQPIYIPTASLLFAASVTALSWFNGDGKGVHGWLVEGNGAQCVLVLMALYATRVMKDSEGGVTALEKQRYKFKAV